MSLSPYIISHEPVQPGPISQYADVELGRLVNANRVFNRLDWWSPFEWHGSDAFWAFGTGTRLDAALLFVPVEYTDIRMIASSQSTCAWLRWCAVREGVSASNAFRRLFEYGETILGEVGITDTYCIVEPTHWLLSILRDIGYAHSDDVVTMICRDFSKLSARDGYTDGVVIRPARESDLEEITSLDKSSFMEQWRYPNFVLRRALAGSAYFTIAVWNWQIIGYQFATSYAEDAHITRLAVRPDRQGFGVGAMLLTDALHYLKNNTQARAVTLNTQASNRVSQRLYRRIGFDMMRPTMRVMHKRHDLAHI